MQDQDVKVSIGIYGSKESQGGSYNLLSSFTNGLCKAFKKLNSDSGFVSEFNLSEFKPNLTISIGVSEVDAWESTLEAGIPHVMFAIDSPFKNYNTIAKFLKYSHFIITAVSPIDKFPMHHFFPGIPFLYVPHGFDPEIWNSEDTQKEHDLIFMSSIVNVEEEMDKFKERIEPKLFEIAFEMYRYALDNPEIAFWEVYKYFASCYDLDLNNSRIYSTLFDNINDLVTYSRRISLVKKLKDFNLKIWGSPQWEKYIEGKVQYMGSADFFESVDIVKKSKICLHLQPMQTLLGMHERVINAMATKCFVLSDYNLQLDSYFMDFMGFYNNRTFEDLPDLVSYYLKHDNTLLEKACQAYLNVNKYHRWDNRASFLLKKLTGQ